MAVYGIDLGTCYSCIVKGDGGNFLPVELLNAGGRKFIPSVVTYDKRNGQPKVGLTGKACLMSRPECTKAYVKREMDKEFCDNPITVIDKVRKLSPVEASACILYYLVSEANKLEQGAGKDPIKQAVITIPAKFDEKQRARTKLAAEFAGIEVLGLLQEPTAAAIAYDIPAGSTALVFDLGGGTLDVSIVTNDKGNYKVIGTPAGDGELGGMDWDEALVRLCLQKAGKKVDPSNVKAWNRMMSMAENIKQALTENDSIIDDEVVDGNIIEDEEIEIERYEFENACETLLNRCIAVVDQAIENAKKQKANLKIDFFLTVGGSSRMPMIRKTLAKKYGPIYGKGKAEADWLRIKDPDTAIAIGAAKYAHMISNVPFTADKTKKNLQAVEDKATHSYGIKISKDGNIVVHNFVKSTDPIVYQGVIDTIALARAGRRFQIDILENGKSEEYASVDESKVINSCPVDMGKEMAKGTPAKLLINRDKNGLISITLSCGGFTTTFEANPPETLIDDETRENINHSIALMSNS